MPSILYLIYNVDLIEISGGGVTRNGGVDDACFMAKGDSECETIRKLRSAYQKADRWARIRIGVRS
jgi:hypothetical protein